MDRTILVCTVWCKLIEQTQQLYKHIVDLYFETHNFSSIERILRCLWIESFETFKQQSDLLQKQFTLEGAEQRFLAQFLSLSDNTIQNLVHHWWQTFGEPTLQEQLQHVRQIHGTVLRCDHTYKCVSTLGTTIDHEWVGVH